ncbi:HAD family hydrolase [Salinimicrobium sp. HB62]|uniref:HAD family hydrolase n=1 Tax=Salinimicrobium sp. HB62 TaxID=3077781 RepID=UPI002D77522C|nr:HAD hydrolase-like protein [Salinimicrobium sp. HB62]
MFKPNVNIKNILWDFDGVIMDSMAVRDRGFEIVLKEHSKEEIEKLMAFHRANGGLSRYMKFRYFFNEIKKEQISDEEIRIFASKFSEIMLENLVNPVLLIDDALNFIQRKHQLYNMHVVSGSDQEELRHICKKVNISTFFHSIYGSPTPKKLLVKEVLKNNNYKNSETILIGDSINDYEAAVENGITFFGYNNIKLKEDGKNYIESFSV